MSEVVFRDAGDGPVLENEFILVSVHLNRGTFNVHSKAEGGSVTGAATSVRLTDGPSFTSRGAGFFLDGDVVVDDVHGRGRAITLQREAEEHEPDVALSVAVYEGAPFAVFQSEIANSSRSGVRVAAFHVLDGGRVDLGAAPADWRFYKEGWQDWSPALVLPVSGEDAPMEPPVIAPATRPEAREGRFLSEMVTVLAAPSGRALLAGFVSAAEQFSQVWLDRDEGVLTAASYADGIEVPAGGRLASEALLVGPSTQPLESIQRYGRELGRRSGATPWPRPVSGWCSWYHYFQGVSEAEVLANLDEITERRRELPFDYVQIDDGYQAGIGDWLTPNEKFPHGIGWLAERIHERGFKAGLWLAPFLIGEKSRLWQDHPGWAVQYKPGQPHVASLNWEQRCYALDLTNAAALGWLEKTFRTVFDEWGYDYVKIDFIYAGGVDGIRHDPNVTRAQAYRRGIDTIRRVAGDRFVLGCGQPIGPSIGVVNGARIGPDVAPFWHPLPRRDGRHDMSSVSTLNAMRNTLSRFWVHQSLWLNDPDCLLARDTETALTAAEVRTLATVIALSGGMVLDSDRLPGLSAERREIISMLLPVYGKSAVPLDLFTADGMPQLFELDCGSHRVLGAFNWADDDAEVKAPLAGEDTHVFDVWQRAYLGVRGGDITLPLPAHGCALLRLTPALNRPQLVGSTFHLLQGAIEIVDEKWDGGALTLSLAQVAVAEGALYIVAPVGQDPKSEDGTISQAGEGLWALRLRIDEPGEVTVRFS